MRGGGGGGGGGLELKDKTRELCPLTGVRGGLGEPGEAQPGQPGFPEEKPACALWSAGAGPLVLAGAAPQGAGREGWSPRGGGGDFAE